jgi:hypothetical protein
MKKYSLSALVAAGLLAGAATSASAADLGGNCCADLEERIAELEATTARKGNRKVSLTISGWVAEQVMWWDDGAERNTYVTGLGTTLASHFTLSGSAQIRPGLKAGYTMVIEADTADPLLVSQTNDDTAVGVNVQQSYWYLKDDHWGQVSVGQLSPVSHNTAILVDGSGSLVPANWVLFDNQNFQMRWSNGVLLGNWGRNAHCNTNGLNSGGFAGDCGSGAVPGNYVRYDSPVLHGFQISADWGEDDAWDIGLKWSGEHSGFKLAFATSYYETNETKRALNGLDGASYFQLGVYAQHIATGLFVYGAYGSEESDYTAAFRAANPLATDSAEMWYIKAGLRKNLMPYGATVLYGEYGEKNNATDYGFWNGAVVSGTSITQWGLGVVQEIDAAAMSLFLNYRNYQADLTCGVACTHAGIAGAAGTTFESQDMHVIKAGALINF